MRISIAHNFSLETAADWILDEQDPAVREQLGIYLRSQEHGIYLNVRAEQAGGRGLTTEGLLQVLREQSWASPPFDEWVLTVPPLVIVGGTFETVDMNGEVVLEVFASDARSLVNFATPGERAVIAAATPSVQRLAQTLRFE